MRQRLLWEVTFQGSSAARRLCHYKRKYDVERMPRDANTEIHEGTLSSENGNLRCTVEITPLRVKENIRNKERNTRNCCLY